MAPFHEFEDRWGTIIDDYDDRWDRLFLRVAPPSCETDRPVYMIYDMGRRSTRAGQDTRHLEKQPRIVLEFGQGQELGTIHLNLKDQPTRSIPMHRYLRRTALVGG